MLHKVNIQSVSNIVSYLRLFDSYGFLKNYDIALNFTDSKIDVFWHTYGQPCQGTLDPNYWSTMIAV